MRTVTLLYPNRAGPLMACAVMTLFGLTAPASADPTRRVVLPAGSVIPVRLDQEMSSKTARSGERFTTTVRLGNDDAGMPEGTRIEGVIREAQRSQDGKPGMLDLEFNRMVTPGGQNRQITGSLIALNGKGVKPSDSGRLIATGDKSKDRLKFIGIGAGGGLLIGTLTKNNAILSTLLGAGAGYLYNEFGNKPKPGDVNLKAGAEFGIRLDRELAFDTNQPAGYAQTTDRGANDDRSNSGRYSDRQSTRLNDAQNRIDRPSDSTDDIGMMIDDRDVPFDSAKPFMRGSQVMVPLEAVARAANFDYRYDKANRMISARSGALRLPLNSRIARMNGARHRMAVASEERDGTLYVPLQFISLATGATAIWESDSRTVILTTNQRKVPIPAGVDIQ